MILYVDMLNHKHSHDGDNLIINVDSVEYLACRDILLNTKITTRPYRLSRNVIVLETEKENDCVYIALTEKDATGAANCSKIKFVGPEKTITVDIKEEDIVIKRAVLSVGQN